MRKIIYLINKELVPKKAYNSRLESLPVKIFEKALC